MADPMWKGLLNWTLKNATPSMDVNNNVSKFKKMSKEDLDFLTKALESTKEAERQLEAAITNTANFTKGEFDLEDDQILENLYLIESYLDDHPAHSLDIAKNEILNTLMKLIEHSNIEISKQSLQILTSALGNNEVVARAAYDRGLLDVLVARMDSIDDISPILSTMAALVSSHPQSSSDFVKYDLFNLFNRIFTTGYSLRTKEKTAMLIYHLAINKTIADLSLVKTDEIIASVLPFGDESLQYKETFLEMLLSLLRNYPNCLNEESKRLLNLESDSEGLRNQILQIKKLI